MENMQQREYYLDNVCGVLILHMIFTYHQTGFCRYNSTLLDYVQITLSFFMFWFFFKGGMMYKSRTIKDVIKVSVKRLLVPYVVFLLLGFLCDVYLETLHDNPSSFSNFFKTKLWEIINKSTLEAAGPCWFLLSLFVVRIAFQLCTKYRFSPIIIAIASFFLAYFLYFCCYKYNCSYLLQWRNGDEWNLHIPYYWGNMSLGLMCYSLGYVLREKQYSKWVFYISILLFIAKFFYKADIGFIKNDSYESNYLLAVVYGVTGCIVINNIFKRIANVKISVLTNIGKNSMIYYLVHWPVMYLITLRFYGSIYSLSPENRYIVLSCILALVLMLSGIIFQNKRFGVFFGM